MRIHPASINSKFSRGKTSKPPLKGGGQPLPHLAPSQLRCSITIVDGKIRIPLFKPLATGLIRS
ncbi:hypothetical protein DPMN_170929 [Dreissena polymorpha]|uniref:Uncharacterized protein n=1 Tax=Dreissena polymorpha TaxID=45954 RepID=A0A9D4IDA7_DREPO|nr:hypothetical protein DPMN_170929 [Dreissena polymorpha]